ncbi:unnamed protein product [Caenorhabditis bovis]|uniref:Phytanoyl-CoA hydroxylase-interacting protein-like C-terminal domain-containing protein n=1 Tax=Caenorhabditis bovis TaxID=2654633 RepID=A0A8S1F333_9PELO|nr:unnamed protein product [Caenorhabditis bovis]
MSFTGWNFPVPQTWRNPNFDPSSWRPYGNVHHQGPIRIDRHQPPPSQRNYNSGWNNYNPDPYFSNSNHSQVHAMNYERNRMHLFHQSQTPYHPPAHIPSTSTAGIPMVGDRRMTDFAKQELLKNAHVPGLKTGQKLRDAMRERQKARTVLPNLVREYNMQKLEVTTNVSSERIEIRWKPADIKRNVKYEISYSNIKTDKKKYIEKPSTIRFCELRVVAGEVYRIEIKCIALSNMEIIAHWWQEIRAEFSYEELKQLYNKSIAFVTTSDNPEGCMHEFWMVYRCKPNIYWEEIHEYNNDIMAKYVKDENGQPGNLINGKLHGLFFSARLLKNLTLPPSSPFGNVRMCIDAFFLLNPKQHNFYFADFYCNRDTHYATIVICIINSKTDRYCREKLIKLNPFRNSFVKLIPPTIQQPNWRYFINYAIWVELYYTEDIEINIGQFTAILATGAGTSKIGGLPNNKQCTACNLYPKKKLTGIEAEEITEETKEEEFDGIEDAPYTAESTLKAILRLEPDCDNGVVETVCGLVDKTEELCMTAEELVKKLDPKLLLSVEKLNTEISRFKLPPSVIGLAKSVMDFTKDFSKRRDNLIETLKDFKKNKEHPV